MEYQQVKHGLYTLRKQIKKKKVMRPVNYRLYLLGKARYGIQGSPLLQSSQEFDELFD